MARIKIVLCLAAVVLVRPISDLPAAPFDAAAVPLLTRSFFYGREYFVLRSGRVQMIVQADKADIAPAVLYLLFDARDSRQSKSKETALNFGDGSGFVNSALEVVLGGFAFTALGHETETRWAVVNGIPAVEAVWWAGGLRSHRADLRPGGRRRLRAADQTRSRQPRGAGEGDAAAIAPAGQVHGLRRRASAAGGPAHHRAADRQHAPQPPDSGAWRAGDRSAFSPARTIHLGRYDPVCRDRAARPGHTLAVPAVVRQGPAQALEKTRRQWAASSSITTDNAVVRELFDKARFGLPGMVADNGAMNAGIFEYGGQWVRDTSNTLLGMVEAGHFELARRGFEHVLNDMITDDGKTMIFGGFDNPDREQFDQMGELIHALKAYCDWTGDNSLLREHRAKLLAMIGRPLRPEFRDATGMVHNRREYWERILDDGYELAYQTYVVLGLRDAAELAGPLGAEDCAAVWRAEAGRTLHAMLSHPSRALVEDGRLIKRRGINGQWVRNVPGWGKPDVPGRTEGIHLAEPDATMALPIALGLVDARGALARKTLDELEPLWSARWFGGGYERYHPSAQGDQPGPWPFATCFILRAQHEAGLFDRSRRTLEWLGTVQGGRAGAWFEEIPLTRSWAPKSGILPWTSGEISLFVVRHLLGVRFEQGALVIRPALYPHSPPVSADLRFRQGRLKLRISGSGPIRFAEVDGRRVEPDAQGALRLSPEFTGGSIVLHAGSEP